MWVDTAFFALETAFFAHFRNSLNCRNGESPVGVLLFRLIVTNPDQIMRKKF